MILFPIDEQFAYLSTAFAHMIFEIARILHHSVNNKIYFNSYQTVKGSLCVAVNDGNGEGRSRHDHGYILDKGFIL